jgi:hypothetical protein
VLARPSAASAASAAAAQQQRQPAGAAELERMEQRAMGAHSTAALLARLDAEGGARATQRLLVELRARAGDPALVPQLVALGLLERLLPLLDFAVDLQPEVSRHAAVCLYLLSHHPCALEGLCAETAVRALRRHVIGHGTALAPHPSGVAAPRRAAPRREQERRETVRRFACLVVCRVAAAWPVWRGAPSPGWLAMLLASAESPPSWDHTRALALAALADQCADLLGAAACAAAGGLQTLVRMLRGDAACTVAEMQSEDHHAVLRVLRALVCHAHFDRSILDRVVAVADDLYPKLYTIHQKLELAGFGAGGGGGGGSGGACSHPPAQVEPAHAHAHAHASSAGTTTAGRAQAGALAAVMLPTLDALGMGGGDSVLQLATGALWDLGVLTAAKARVSVAPENSLQQWRSAIADACDRHAY